ncbi:MAG: phospholipase D-like domain-containing protein [Candidatus Paceibacterota bacterium]
MNGSNGIKWQFYLTSEEAWDAMLLEIANAKKSIDLEQYILINDNVGNKFIELLMKKADEGLKIRIFCDQIGSFPLYRSYVKEALLKKGIPLVFFNPVLPWNPNRESLWYFRDHSKLMIIDDEIGFTGGICLAEEMQGWRESYVKIKGPVVSQMKNAFEVMWNKEYRKPAYFFKKKNNNHNHIRDRFRYLTNSPLPRKKFMYKELIRAIKSADHYLYLTTPYFLPNHHLLREIKKASKRGVKVILLIPKNPNHILIEIGSGTFFEDLLEHNVKIFRYEKTMIHSKTAVVDGTWSTIGSLNLDNISLRYNFEANLVSTDKDFSFELEKHFLDDLKLSKELLLNDWMKRPLRRKIVEVIIWPFRKLL